jgi:hypothetical protein
VGKGTEEVGNIPRMKERKKERKKQRGEIERK